MKRFRLEVMAGVLVLLALAACATLQPGADPALVRAEQGLESAVSTLDMLVVADFEHQAELEAVAPGAHAVADRIRTTAPPILRAADAAIGAYRAYLAIVRAPDPPTQKDQDQAAAAVKRREIEAHRAKLETAMVAKLAEVTRLAAEATVVLQAIQKGGAR